MGNKSSPGRGALPPPSPAVPHRRPPLPPPLPIPVRGFRGPLRAAAAEGCGCPRSSASQREPSSRRARPAAIAPRPAPRSRAPSAGPSSSGGSSCRRPAPRSPLPGPAPLRAGGRQTGCSRLTPSRAGPRSQSRRRAPRLPHTEPRGRPPRPSLTPAPGPPRPALPLPSAHAPELRRHRPPAPQPPLSARCARARPPTTAPARDAVPPRPQSRPDPHLKPARSRSLS